MRRRDFLRFGSAAVAAGWSLDRGRAQQYATVRTLGVIWPFTADDPINPTRFNYFENALTALGWQKGVNLRIDYRFAGSDTDLDAQYAAEFVPMAPDVIYAANAPALAAVKARTSVIPVVFTAVVDPIGQGFVTNLARPGGNITGITNFEPPMMGKWLGLLKEIAPAVQRVGLLYNPATAPYAGLLIRAAEAVAQEMALRIEDRMAHAPSDIDARFAELASVPGGGLLALPDAFNSVNRTRIVMQAAKVRIPVIYAQSFFVEDGGLIAYATDALAPYARAAAYLDRILRGAKPGDLPIEGPTKFELAINLKAAKALRLTVSSSLLAQATEVIE